MTNVPIYLHGRVVMYVKNGVGLRRARPNEMLQQPKGWAFHNEVIRQLEAAHVCHLHVECDSHLYAVPWVTFAALSAPLDRGWGAQRFLPLSYWSIDGRPPERAVKAPTVVRQMTLFNS